MNKKSYLTQKGNLEQFKISNRIRTYFQRELLKWALAYPREMPWAGEKDPYKIWLSEIILQQTRVSQGWAYYVRFLKAYSNIKSLAGATLDEVLLHWEGLGYYTRARNLWLTANFITHELNGVFPDNYEDILQLKGIGPYTAAAIASFAFNEPIAVLDGNVFRVLSRFLELTLSPDIPADKKRMNEIANSLIDKQNPGIYNQGIMNLGALVCMPKNPNCASCILNSNCKAFKNHTIEKFPVKKKKIKIKTRYFHFWVLVVGFSVFIEQRKNKDIWHLLYQFPLSESERNTDITELWSHFNTQNGNLPGLVTSSQLYEQQLTHQKIIGQFHIISIDEGQLPTFRKVNIRNLGNFAFPKIVKEFIKKDKLFLTLNK
jgi:A/G-specific adenine glycosylase